MTISKPFYSESRTIWYVHDGDTCVATLELGQFYRSAEGALYELVDVIWHTGYVVVARLSDDDMVGERYTWWIESLINSHMKEIAHA